MKGRKRSTPKAAEDQGFTWTDKEYSYFYDHFNSAELLLRLLATAASGEASTGTNNFKMDALQVSEICKVVLSEFKILERMLDIVRPPLPDEG